MRQVMRQIVRRLKACLTFWRRLQIRKFLNHTKLRLNYMGHDKTNETNFASLVSRFTTSYPIARGLVGGLERVVSYAAIDREVAPRNSAIARRRALSRETP